MIRRATSLIFVSKCEQNSAVIGDGRNQMIGMIGSNGEVIGGVVGTGVRALIGGKKRHWKTKQSNESGKCSRKLRPFCLFEFLSATLGRTTSAAFTSLCFVSGGRGAGFLFHQQKQFATRFSSVGTSGPLKASFCLTFPKLRFLATCAGSSRPTAGNCSARRRRSNANRSCKKPSGVRRESRRRKNVRSCDSRAL